MTLLDADFSSAWSISFLFQNGRIKSHFLSAYLRSTTFQAQNQNVYLIEYFKFWTNVKIVQVKNYFSARMWVTSDSRVLLLVKNTVYVCINRFFCIGHFRMGPFYRYWRQNLLILMLKSLGCVCLFSTLHHKVLNLLHLYLYDRIPDKSHKSTSDWFPRALLSTLILIQLSFEWWWMAIAMTKAIKIW